MIYFTSDLHLGHRGIITMRNRPFANVEEIRDFKMVSCIGEPDFAVLREEMSM